MCGRSTAIYVSGFFPFIPLQTMRRKHDRGRSLVGFFMVGVWLVNTVHLFQHVLCGVIAAYEVSLYTTRNGAEDSSKTSLPHSGGACSRVSSFIRIHTDPSGERIISQSSLIQPKVSIPPDVITPTLLPVSMISSSEMQRL